MRIHPALALSAALLLASCLSQTGVPCTLGPWQKTHNFPPAMFIHVPLSYRLTEPGYRKGLHEACRRCAAIEFSMMVPGKGLFLHRVERKDAEAALEQILRTEHWYTRSTPPGVAFGPRGIQYIRFLDAENRLIRAAGFAAAGYGYLHDGNRYLSLWEFFASWLDPVSLK